MEILKQKAIREAYGELWEIVKETVDENGWFDNSHETNYICVGDHNISLEYKSNLILRPLSLEGIENNNGWVTINSEKDLPKESGEYLVIRNGKVGTGTYNSRYKGWICSGQYYFDTYRNINISHYQSQTLPDLNLY